MAEARPQPVGRALGGSSALRTVIDEIGGVRGGGWFEAAEADADQPEPGAAGLAGRSSRPTAKIFAASCVGAGRVRDRVRSRKSPVLSLKVTVTPESSFALSRAETVSLKSHNWRSSVRKSDTSRGERGLRGHTFCFATAVHGTQVDPAA